MDTTDSELYTLAGFKVKTYYKCIFPTCTDFWCNANCNHKPSYCPASFCQKKTTKIRVPTPDPTAHPTMNPTSPPAPPVATPTHAPTHTPTDRPTNEPTPAPTCKKTNAWGEVMSKNAGANYWGTAECPPIVCLG